MTPFEVVDLFTTKKQKLDFDNEDKKAYIPFLINKTLSFNVETLMYANDMNINYNLDNDLQFDYYFYSLPKKKYYFKWAKDKKDDDVLFFSKHFGYNIKKSREALAILTDEQLKTIKTKLEQGGIK